MTLTGEANASGLTNRVRKILVEPKAEWPVIEAESTDVQKLYREYIAILAAIPAVATFIGYSIIGVSLPFVGNYRVGMARGIASMIVTYVLTLVGAYIAAMVIDKLAPTFESKPNLIQALKLVAYASTPSWIAGVFNIIPALGVLALIGALYAVYLFYLGLPVMMKTPQAKVIPYMVVAAIIVIVVSIVIGVITTALTGGAAAVATF
jgi:hypothetical protein